jgi:DNA-binding Xre family transcriptional regulator
MSPPADDGTGERGASRTGSRKAGSGEQALLGRLGLRVKILRTGRGMAQEFLAAAAGLDRSYISRVERGVHNITVLTLVRLADALDCPPGDLLNSAIHGDQRICDIAMGRTRS